MRYFTTLTCCFVLLLLWSCKSSKKASLSSKTNISVNKGTERQSNQKVNKVISRARTYIGTPYKFGGNSRAGIDCSGLIKSVFAEVGIVMPRTSQEQSLVGVKISFDALQPGDLVFFVNKKGDTQITHVGLVSNVDGPKNAKFIHSSTKLGVVESDLYVSYYENILIKATRIL